jgi:hypothetical protein
LERHDPFLPLDLADQHLDTEVVDSAEVFESEHEQADIFREFGLELGESHEHALLGAFVDIIEDLRHRPRPAYLLSLHLANLMPQHVGHLLDDAWRRRTEPGDAICYVFLFVVGKQRKNLSGVRRKQVRKNEGNRLWMLVLQKLGKRLALHLMQRVDAERRIVGFVKDSADDVIGLFRTHRLGEHAHEIFGRLLRKDIDIGLAQMLARVLEDLFDVLGLDLRHAVNALTKHDQLALLQ